MKWTRFLYAAFFAAVFVFVVVGGRDALSSPPGYIYLAFLTANVAIASAPQLPTTPAGLCLVLSAGEQGGADLYITTIKKVRVQYRL